MDIEKLTQTQIILLALLVSFVTSIATGIVTVTLMDQAPPGVTQTINRIIERTEQVIVPGKKETITETVIVKEEDYVVKAVEKNSPNLIFVEKVTEGKKLPITDGGREFPVTESVFETIGTGFVISPEEGIVIARPPLLGGGIKLAVRTLGGERFEASILPDTIEGGFSFLAIGDSYKEGVKAADVFSRVEFTDSNVLKVGQTAIALGIDGGLHLLMGTISHLDREGVMPQDDKGERQIVTAIYTTIKTDNWYDSGPLLTSNGSIMGINVSRAYGEEHALPASAVLKALEKYRTSQEGVSR